MTVPPLTQERQRRATDPGRSAWVSANAGSGKTFVLARRVIRLLLSGADPARILCLTFTKAAAAEMANRVFETLAGWTTMADEALAGEVGDIDGQPPDAARLAQARRLFARALETPGGLKVQTIHAFCEALLQRFPVEAGIAGRFEVLDDRSATRLTAEAGRMIYAAAASGQDPQLAEALADLQDTETDGQLAGALGALLRDAERLRQAIVRLGGLDDGVAGRIAVLLGVSPGRSIAAVEAAILSERLVDDAMLTAICTAVAALAPDKKKVVALAEKIAGFRAATGPENRRDAWQEMFLTEAGTIRKTIIDNKAVRDHLPGIEEAMQAEALRLVGLLAEIAALRAATRTARLLVLADRQAGFYGALKAAAGALDFSDLVERTVALISRSDATAWVLYKLDQGLDHVLVDEAQDTSAAQWAIVEAITGDFFAGAGARGRAGRTVFAVGDEKQSIYSFQGADPRLFSEMRARFRQVASGVGHILDDIPLTVSFRSAPEVVKAVDRVFAPGDAHDGLSMDAGPPVHETVRLDQPGLVEVWEPVEAATAEEPERWEDPVDRTDGGPATVLAARIADQVADWVHSGRVSPALGRPVRPRDVLVLVRNRTAVAEAVNRALRARDVPVAGADRLDVLGHIVARDLIAAAAAALLPEDDLVVAALARSPLVDLSEDDLYRIAWNRGPDSLLRRAGRLAEAGDAAAARLAGSLRRWMDRADVLTPFAFFSAILGPDGGRAAFRARFGPEADEVADEVLSMVLSLEERGTATLTSVVEAFRDGHEEIRRENDGRRDEARVMTVHGSKGLEAPVVFLIDGGEAPAGPSGGEPLLWVGSPPLPVWPVSGSHQPEAIRTGRGDRTREREREYRRLLYVGLTRARHHLIVAGIKRKKSFAGRWHLLVTDALAAESEADDSAGFRRWLWRLGGARATGAAPAASAAPASLAFPQHLLRPPPGVAGAASLAPSRSGRDRSAPSPGFGRRPDAGQAPARGVAVHRLLELLPGIAPADRAAAAAGYLARALPGLAMRERDGLVAAVLACLDDTAFAPVFGADGRAEVGLAGDILAADGQRHPVSGQVDRLVIAADRILVVDYKTAARVPDVVPEAYVLQLGLYRRLLADLRPGMPVEAAILWVDAPRLDRLAADAMDAAVDGHLTKLGSARSAARS